MTQTHTQVQNDRRLHNDTQFNNLKITHTHKDIHTLTHTDNVANYATHTIAHTMTHSTI